MAILAPSGFYGGGPGGLSVAQTSADLTPIGFFLFIFYFLLQWKGLNTMKVILQQDVKGQGKKGQMIEASDGYARNFLLPRKLAILATPENVNTMKMQDKAKKAQEAAEKAEAEAVAAKLKEITVKVTAKAGAGGRLFGAVTSKEIADCLKAQHGIDVAKTKLVQDEPIKSFGTYELKVKLGYEVSGTLKVMVTEE